MGSQRDLRGFLKLLEERGQLRRITAPVDPDLELAATLLSGSVNAVQIWVQFDDATATVATDNNISLALSTLTVTAS